jgi:aspartyl-tRNA(Asn)/glutamyl-tRNA(Gln) amidotransferase subunit A
MMVAVPELAAQPFGRGEHRDKNTQAKSMDRDLLEITVPGLEKLYAKHRYTVTEVTQWYLDRIDRYDGTYRAILYLDKQGALRRASEEDAEPKNAKHGPLWGVPIVVKANTSVKGRVTSAGWIGFLRPGEELVAPRDAVVVQRLRESGAVLLGQTNMPDFAASDTNVSTAGGRTGDAYDVRYSPGGSSGGTATAVAANFAVLGTGTDTANSIRQPAANNSLVGMLPTRGLTSIAGIEPLDWLRDNTGPLVRDVTSAAIALDVMQAEDPLDASTKGSAKKAEVGPYTRYLKKGALKGKRFGVP